MPEFTVSFLIILVAGLLLGLVVAQGARHKEDGSSVAFTVLLVLGLIATVAAVVVLGIRLITFRWGELLQYLLWLVGVALLVFIPSHHMEQKRRRKLYRNNPVMQEIAAFCNTHKVRAVRCTSTGVVMYKTVVNEAYCASETFELTARSAAEQQHMMDTFQCPGLWRAFDEPENIAGTLAFRDRGYPPVEDLDIFAGVLRELLTGTTFHLSRHSAKITFVNRYRDTEGTRHEDTLVKIVYRDVLLFAEADRKALRKKARADKAAKEEADRFRKTTSPTGKSWE